ncbi:MAG TPA: alpha/beta hydrolase-fold protein [Polyangia bacterium]|nr:alpha/beta hydrolase-fold protein [Polyangia bacterium]
MRLLRLLGIGGPRRLETVGIDSALLGRRMPCGLLRPPPGDGSEADLAVLFLLHGLGDSHLALDRFGLGEKLYRGMEAKSLPRAFVIAPTGERGFWIDWYDGSRPYERYFVEEVIPAAERLLGLEVPRERRHLIGVSMGGIGGLQIGLRHPHLFASVASLSGPIMDEQQAVEHLETSPVRRFVDLKRIFGDGTDREHLERHNPHAIARARGADLGTRLFISAGRDEKPFFRETTAAFHRLLERLGAPHEFELFEGGHGWRYWAPVIERVMARAVTEPERPAWDPTS